MVLALQACACSPHPLAVALSLGLLHKAGPVQRQFLLHLQSPCCSSAHCLAPCSLHEAGMHWPWGLPCPRVPTALWAAHMQGMHCCLWEAMWRRWVVALIVMLLCVVVPEGLAVLLLLVEQLSVWARSCLEAGDWCWAQPCLGGKRGQSAARCAAQPSTGELIP